MSDERKPVWPWIVALLIGLPVVYPMSFVAFMQLCTHGILPEWFEASISWIWFPLIESCYWLSEHGPEWMQPVIEWYDEMIP